MAFVAMLHPAAAEGGEAEDGGTAPRLDVSISFEVQNDYTFDADDPDAELNDLYATIEPHVALYFTPELALNTSLVFEPVEDPEPGVDRAFEDHGLYVEELRLDYDAGWFTLFGGKFNPPFGVAWDIAPGIYGTDLAEDYELTERIGFGGGPRFGSVALGRYQLTVATFFRDTSFLSGSAITDRGEIDEGDGGLSNTGDLSSFSVAVDGGGAAALPGLNYHLAVSRQHGGAGDPEDEVGLAAAVYGEFEPIEGVLLQPVAEWARFENAEGAAQDRDYLTLGAAAVRGPWNLALAWTGRLTDPEPAGEADADDHQFQVSAGYAFESGLTVDVGYRFLDEDGAGESHTVGLLIAYELEFSLLP